MSNEIAIAKSVLESIQSTAPLASNAYKMYKKWLSFVARAYVSIQTGSLTSRELRSDSKSRWLFKQAEMRS
jgi:hypothetical protein